MKATASDRLVIDASVAISWYFEDERTPYAKSILLKLAAGAEAIVPSLWPFEIANVLLQAERRKRITAAQAEIFLKQLRNFNLTIDSTPLNRIFEWILFEARRKNLTAYDAAYLELALRHSLALATLDNNLKRAAKDLGVPLAR